MSKFYENRLVINRLWHDYFHIKPQIIPRKRNQPSAFGFKLIPLSLEWYGAWYESNHVIISLYLQIWTGSVVLPIVMCPKEADRMAPSVHPDVCPNLSVAIFTIIMVSCLYLIHLMTKPIKWPVCPAKTQISLGIHPVWSESSLSAWRKPGSLATHWMDSESDQTGRIPSLIWVFAEHTVILLGLPWGSSVLLSFMVLNLSTTSFSSSTFFLNNQHYSKVLNLFLHTQPEIPWTWSGLGNVVLHEGRKTTLMHDVRMSFWHHDASFDFTTSVFTSGLSVLMSFSAKRYDVNIEGRSLTKLFLTKNVDILA